MAVVGGNVSLYNEGTTGPIYPTPVVGMVGELPDASKTAPLGFANEGDRIAIVGRTRPQLAVSELAKLRGLPLPDGLPEWDIAEARATIEAVRDAVRRGDLSSVTDVAEGGIATAIAESAIAGGLGAQVDAGEATTEAAQEAAWHLLFGEAPGLFVVSGSDAALERLAQDTGVDVIGIVSGDRVQIHAGGVAIDESVDGLAAIWRDGLRSYFP